MRISCNFPFSLQALLYYYEVMKWLLIENSELETNVMILGRSRIIKGHLYHRHMFPKPTLVPEISTPMPLPHINHLPLIDWMLPSRILGSMTRLNDTTDAVLCCNTEPLKSHLDYHSARS